MLNWIRSRSSDVVDVFVYIVVLNLAIEYIPSVISESFTLSILTALLLKITLEVVRFLEAPIMQRLKGSSVTPQRAFWASALWALLVGTKLIVLELIAVVFGDYVSLGGFISVTGLVICLILARAGVRWLLSGSTKS